MAKLNYHHAELLFHVLQARTLTDAAGALRISQPSVTKQLRLLESQLGVQLFKKEGRRLVPTTEAILLADEVGRTKASLASLNALAGSLKSGLEEKLIVCVIPTLAQILIPTVINEFRESYPGIHVDVKVENSWRTMDLAEVQQIDIGLCHPFREMHEVEETVLIKSEMVCVVRRDHALAGKSAIALSELRGNPIVNVEVTNDPTSVVKHAITTAGLDRDVVCTVTTATLACEIALSTEVVAIVDRLTAAAFHAHGVVTIPLPELPPRRISLLRPKHRPSSVFADSFVRVVNARVSSLAGIAS
ncbi:DNA-binding transcriptional LysR family regulator [Paraburkholderia sp. GAS199]|uniref:LysR substrate-binding domain-containing protein n=1 Tax=Paraburkholderia sp. GAS199 TaxID=3035126 RepID=UPI003D196EEA